MRRLLTKILSPFHFIASRRGGLPLMIIAATAVVSVMLVTTRPRLEIAPAPERVWTAEVVEVRQQNITPQLSLFGEVIAGRQTELRALVAGPIVEVGSAFFEGGIVSRGELLVAIDPFDYEIAVNEQQVLLVEAEASLEILRRNYERTQELYKERNASEQALDNALLEIKRHEAVLDMTRIALEKARRDLADVRLTAPYDGVLMDVTGDQGKQLSVNDKVSDLIDLNQLNVRFTLSNEQFGRIRDTEQSVIGRPLQIDWQVGDKTLTYSATIARIGAEIDSTTGGVEVYADIDEGGGVTDLRPGAFVSVNIPDQQYNGVMLAPERALYGDDVVYVVKDERLEERRIAVLGYSGEQIIFRSDGLPVVENGDLVLTTQIRESGPGLKVRVRQP